MMIVCKNKNCPYQQQDQCGRRVTIINQLGLCAFLFKGQQTKQNINIKNLIKREIAVGEGEIVQMQNEDLISQTAAQEVKENE